MQNKLYLNEFIISVAAFFREKEYIIPYSFEVHAFQALAEIFRFDIEEGKNILFDKDLYQIESVLMSLFSGSREQSLNFHEYYEEFIRSFEYPELSDISVKEAKGFKKEYDSKANRLRSLEQNIQYIKQRRQTVEGKLKKIEKVEEVNIPKKKRNTYERIKDDYEDLAKGLDKRLVRFIDLLEKGIERLSPEYSKNRESLNADISKLLDRAFTKMDNKDLTDYISWQIQIIKKADDHYNTKKAALIEARNEIESRLKAMEKERQELDGDIRKNRKTYEAISKIILKENSGHHREVFGNAHNAVQSTYEGDISDTEFRKLSEAEKAKVRRFINTNALDMKTRLARNLRTKRHDRIDMAQTVKYACSTGGIPIKLAYVKPKREKTKLILFLDISGSCKNASEMMLTFAHSVNKAFPGGCKSYVFVNKLYDASGFFEKRDAEEAVKAIFETVPTKGVYSDYYRPLKQFCEDGISEVDKNTIVLFMGDARNNKNATGEEYMMKICARARSVYFMDTESKEKWDLNDSVIGIYGKYMDGVFETWNPRQLINAALKVR